MKKKALKKSKRPAGKKKEAKKRKPGAKKAAPKKKPVKPIGRVTHFYNHIKVAIVKFNKNVKAGTELHYRGATTDFKEKAGSMQFDHKPVATAPKGKQIGIKVKKRVRDGDLVFAAE